MPDLVQIRRALLSVSNKTDLAPFARSLCELGVEIISTGGTARALSEAGIDVTPVDAVTGFPEMMDGRIKTLHPAIHGALLGRRDIDAHVRAMADHDITPIDLLCVNLYPFEHTIQQADVTTDQAIEQIDIGGPAMLRSAAKNYDAVTVITDPSQYDRVINELRANAGSSTLDMRRDLASAAFSRTAEYDTAISSWMSRRQAAEFPQTLHLTYTRAMDLRYGENPHQHAAVYSNPASVDQSVVRATVLHGKPLSFNNVLDASAAVELARDLHAAHRGDVGAVIVKHTNPCGAGIAPTAADAFELAYAGDPLAAYGGILAISQPVDAATAEAICHGQKFLEVIVAPSYDDAAQRMLAERWKNVRLLALGTFDRSPGARQDLRSVPGGVLLQDRDLLLPRTDRWTHAAGPPPDERTRRDAVLATLVVKHLKSNAIAICAGGQLLGGGCGQVDRVTACRLAVEKAGARIGQAATPPVASSDAFFPFDDGPRVLIEAGVRCIVQPGGSKRDPNTFKLCDEHDVTCLITGTRHFRH